MAVVTIDGQIGAGGPEVGRRVARMMEYDFHDRLILAGAARKIGATVEAVQEKERRVHRRSDGLWRFLDRAISGLALSSVASEPYFGTPHPDLLPLTWDVSESGPKTSSHELQSRDLAEALGSHIREIAAVGDAVIIHRAGCMELSDVPDALKVGLFAPWQERVRRLMMREGLTSIDEAASALRDREQAQLAYFQDFHGAHPHDSELYDISIDTSSSTLDIVALNVTRAVRSLVGQSQDASLAGARA